MRKMEDLNRLIQEAEKLVVDTRLLVQKGWERKSRLQEAEDYLEGLKRLQGAKEAAELQGY